MEMRDYGLLCHALVVNVEDHMLPNYLDRKIEADFFEKVLREERPAENEPSIQ
jgi:hypothetical protein